MTAARSRSSRGTSALARTSHPSSPSCVAPRDAHADVRFVHPLADRHERCANFGDIPARAQRTSSPRDPERVSNAIASPAFRAETSAATRRDAWSRRFVVAEASRPARIVCDHAGLNARTAVREPLRPRVRAILFNFFGVAFDRDCVDRNRTGAITPAFDRENFLLAATTAMGGIKHGTVRTHSIPRGRTDSTFLSRARQVVRHRRESDPGGASRSMAPSRPGFPREGSLSSEELGSVDQGGPRWRRP